MSSGARKPLAEAAAIAQDLLALVADTCERAEIAGSIRRKERMIGDVELVVIPKVDRAPVRDLFGEVADHQVRDLFNARCAELLARGVFQQRLNKNGSPAWGAELKWGIYQDFAIDLYSATPETWGGLLLIRTGPADFSHRIVTDRRHGGLCPSDLHFRGWRLRHRVSGDALETPEERDVFEALGYRWIGPEQRLPSTVPPRLGGRTITRR